ncbi:hypothetical protein Despr_2000 [Candidatus Moduliflexus flocculans]|uniref:DUF1848 domain-containing protein n=1 Tax=Candidatus Moduliflexus flocculans TaxID=1499966 RepID=A0A081BNG2_9BACT|nr:hypothetical protein Despr_2000 [Candidatus Moduliflexus flocculans]
MSSLKKNFLLDDSTTKVNETMRCEVISVSRRTDVPAWYADWFMKRIRAGFAQYRNPFGGQTHEVSLRPEDVMAFVFWSRNYAPLLPHLPELDDRGYSSYFHFTLTDYDTPLEPSAPPTDHIIKIFHALANRYSPKHVLWRFDPIIFSEKMPPERMLERFERLAERLKGTTERCYISLVDSYQKVRKNVEPLIKQGWWGEPPNQETLQSFAAQLVALAQRNDITLHACCETVFSGIDGIQQAHCVDPLLLAQLFPDTFHALRPAPTREGCGCFASRDIGAYDTCVHGCAYCYANASHAKALARFNKHDPQRSSL